MQFSETEAGPPDPAPPNSPSARTTTDNGPSEPGPRIAAQADFKGADLRTDQQQVPWQQPTRTETPDGVHPEPVDFNSTPDTGIPISAGRGFRESAGSRGIDSEQNRLTERVPAENDSVSTVRIEDSGPQTLGRKITEAAGDLGQVRTQAGVDEEPPGSSSGFNPEGQAERSVGWHLGSNSSQSPTETPATNATPGSGSNPGAEEGSLSTTTGIHIGKVRLSRRAQMPAALGPAAAPSLARTPKTEAAYAVHVRHLYRRSVDKRTTDPQMPANVTPLEVVQDLIATISNGSASSWNLYRAAMLWHTASHRSTAPEYELAYQLLAGTRPAATRRSPSSKKKTIPEADLNELIDVLGGMNRTTNWGAKTQFWLQAALASGARPGEWPGASWLDDTQTVLCIQNSKRKRTVPIWKLVSPGKTIHDVEADHPERLPPGSEFDDSKRIRNVPIDPSGRLYVRLHLGAMNDYLDAGPQEDREHRFTSYFNMCRKVLNQACHRAFNGKKLYSLYVMRSQFAANKKAEMPLEDVAEMMGHESSGKTTKKNYGPMSAAHGGSRRPSPSTLQSQAKADRSQAAVEPDVPTDTPRD